MSDLLKIDVSSEGEVTRISFEGNMDTNSSPEARDSLMEAIDDGSKKILVEINQPRARRAGVTSQDIALSLQTALSGLEGTQYREDDKVIPVTLRSVAADR